MAKRESFLIRLDPRVLNSIRKWADDEMRSVNGQIEYLLRQCAGQAGRLGDARADATRAAPTAPSADETEGSPKRDSQVERAEQKDPIDPGEKNA